MTISLKYNQIKNGLSINSLWAKPLIPNENDEEFESESLSDVWTPSFTPSSSAIDPYAGFSTGSPRISVNDWKKSCLAIQCPGDNTSYYISKSMTIPTNCFFWIRGTFSYRVDQDLNNESAIGMRIGQTSGGQIDVDNNVSLFLFETDSNTAIGPQAQYSVGGVTTVIKEFTVFNTNGTVPVYEYIGIQKLDTTYHYWLFTDSGQAMWVGSATAAISPDRIGLWFHNSSITAPGNMINTVDFFRVVESATFLPGYG